MKLQFDYTTYNAAKYHGKRPNCGKTFGPPGSVHVCG